MDIQAEWNDTLFHREYVGSYLYITNHRVDIGSAIDNLAEVCIHIELGSNSFCQQADEGMIALCIVLLQSQTQGVLVFARSIAACSDSCWRGVESTPRYYACELYHIRMHSVEFCSCLRFVSVLFRNVLVHELKVSCFQFTNVAINVGVTWYANEIPVIIFGCSIAIRCWTIDSTIVCWNFNVLKCLSGDYTDICCGWEVDADVIRLAINRG